MICFKILVYIVLPYFSHLHQIDTLIFYLKYPMVSISSKGIFGLCLSNFLRKIYESKMVFDAARGKAENLNGTHTA